MKLPDDVARVVNAQITEQSLDWLKWRVEEAIGVLESGRVQAGVDSLKDALRRLPKRMEGRHD